MHRQLEAQNRAGACQSATFADVLMLRLAAITAFYTHTYTAKKPVMDNSV